MKDFFRCVFTLSLTLNLETSRFHLGDYASKNCTKMRAARAAPLFFFIQPIRSLFFGVVVAFALAVVLA